MTDQESLNISLNNILDEFWQAVFNIYGTYCDAWQGFIEWEKSLEKTEKEALERTRETVQKYPELKEFIERPVIMDDFSYCRYVPVSMQDRSNDMVLPQFSYFYLKERNKIGGINHRYIGNMCVVTIYQYWEDHYRGKIAKVLGLEHKNCIDSPIFGDMRALRESIIHNNGKAKKRIPQKTSKAWFEERDDIVIDRFKFENFIIDEIYSFIKEFRIDRQKFIRSYG